VKCDEKKLHNNCHFVPDYFFRLWCKRTRGIFYGGTHARADGRSRPKSHSDAAGSHSAARSHAVYFYLQEFAGWYHFGELIKTLTLDGVTPSLETIQSGEYPLATNYFAVIRSDTPEDHAARNIINWLLTSAGQDAIEAAGLGRCH